MVLNTSEADRNGLPSAEAHKSVYGICRVFYDSFHSVPTEEGVSYKWGYFEFSTEKEKEKYKRDSQLIAIGIQYNTLNEKRRQAIINNITDYLYAQGGVVEAWPNPYQSTDCRYECDGKKIYDTFDYFGNDFRANFESKNLERIGENARLPEYDKLSPENLKEKFYSDYNAQREAAQANLSEEQKPRKEILKQKAQIEKKLNSAKQKKRRNVSAPSWAIRMILFLAIALSFFVPLFIGATGIFEEQYGNVAEAISNMQKSENIPSKILGFVGFVYQCIPILFCVICSALREAEFNATPLIVILTVILAGIYIVAFVYLAHFLGLFRSKKEREKAIKDISAYEKELAEQDQLLRERNPKLRELEGILKHIETDVKKDFDKRYKAYTKSEEYRALQKEYQEKVQLSRDFTKCWRAYVAARK